MAKNKTILTGTVLKASQLRYNNQNPGNPLAVWEILILVPSQTEKEDEGTVCIKVYGQKAEWLAQEGNPLSPKGSQELVDKQQKVTVEGCAQPQKTGSIALFIDATSGGIHLTRGRTILSGRSAPAPANSRPAAPASKPAPVVEQPSLLTVAAAPQKTAIGDQGVDMGYDEIPF